MYMQIANALLAEINAGVLKPGDKLPSEAELISRYQASRVTVRLAFKHLFNIGVAAPRQGKGSFVLAPLIRHELGEFKGFYEHLLSQGLKPETVLLEYTVDPETMPADAARLKETGLHVIEFVRLYRLEDGAFAQVHSWFAAASVPSASDLEAQPVLALVTQQFNTTIKQAELGIRAVAADAALARALEVRRNSPLLRLRRSSTLSGGQLCEYSEIHIRAERYEFRLTTHGSLSVTSAIHSLGEPLKKATHTVSNTQEKSPINIKSTRRKNLGTK